MAGRPGDSSAAGRDALAGPLDYPSGAWPPMARGRNHLPVELEAHARCARGRLIVAPGGGQSRRPDSAHRRRAGESVAQLTE